ncbi:MAG: Blue-light-activated protein [Syntrophorhabdaceae bacterium PtaU1.Bin034]|nr:MAG: Blue-light-activated protein [Syntrophorhabdaceae bacterium PtaU1.Bin034]
MSPNRILIVEDEGIVAIDIESRLAAMGYVAVGHAGNGDEALELTARLRPDLVLMDIRLQGNMDGIEAADEIRRRFHVPVIFLTAYSERATVERAKLAEPFGFILKPFQDRELQSAIEIAIYKHKAEKEIRRMNRLYDVLSQVNQTVVRIRSREELLPTICRLMVERGSVDLAWIGWLDPHTGRISPAAHFGNLGEMLRDTDFSTDDGPEGQGNPAKVVREGEPFVCNECGINGCPYPPAKTPGRFGFQSCSSFPLRFQGVVCGALSLCVAEPGFFREKEMTLLKEVALDISFALDKIESDNQSERLNEELQRRSRFLQTLMDAMPYPVFYKDAQLRYLGCNTAFEKFIGITRDNLMGKTVFEMWPPDLADVHDRADRDMLANTDSKTQIYEGIMQAGNGIRYDMVFHKALFESVDGAMGGGIIGAMVDITERKRTEESLRLNESRLEALLKLNQMAGASLHDITEFALEEGIRLTGSTIGYLAFLNEDEDVLTMYAWSKNAMEECRISEKPLRYPLATTGLWGEAVRQRKAIITNDYSALQEGKKGYPEGHVALLRHMNVPVFDRDKIVLVAGVGNKSTNYDESDVRQLTLLMEGMWRLVERNRGEEERKKLQDQLLQSQKMECIGQLAGGVAHDFNNLLTVIEGYCTIIQMRIPTGDPLRAMLDEVRLAGERAAALTRQLLAFSRKQILAPVTLDLNSLVADLRKMLGRLIGEDITLSTVLRPGLWPVTADPGQIEQVIMNLAVNARDAMPTGGMLTIETGNVDFDTRDAGSPIEPLAGPCVMLAVTDTGYGMDEPTRTRIFEPFFTTKEPGKGTGLGLATVYGIIKQSGGSIAVSSEPARGTTFKIFLPATRTGGEDAAVPQAQALPAFGNETILLVEDENTLRDLVRTLLEAQGYTVLEAQDGDNALAVSGRYGGSIHLLMTDVVMPGISGRELAERLKTLRPSMKVLFMSGYTDDAVVRHGLLTARVQFLPKPFSPAMLALKVREVLDDDTLG